MPGQTDNSDETMLTYKRAVTTDSEIGVTLYLTDAVQGVFRHGYLLREDLLTSDKQAPAKLNLDETWQADFPGVYLFFPALPGSQIDRQGFVIAVANHLKHPDREYVRFAWFDKPEQWSTGLAAPYEIEVSTTDEKAFSARQYAFTIDNYSLRFAKNNLIYPNDLGNGFIFESGKFANSFGAGKRTTIDKPLELVLAEEAQQGCFRFNLNMSGQELNSLSVSLDYFWNDQRWGVKRLNYLLFDVMQQNKSWPFKAVFDPLNPFNDNTSQGRRLPDRFEELRTALAFTTEDNAGTIAGLPTYFRTSFGRPIELLPLTTTVKQNEKNLRQAIITFNRTDTKKLKCSMVLQGDFHIGVILPPSQSENSRQHFLLCGLSGTETIGFKTASSNYAGDILRFHTLKPAFSVKFPIINSNGQNATVSGALLDHTLTTSWVSILTQAQAGQEYVNFYYSQPQDAPLFKATANSADRLDVFDAPSANLRDGDPDLDCFPLVPVAAAPIMEKSSDHRLQYEIQILNPARKQSIDRYTTKNRPLLTQSPEPDIDPDNLGLTTTPQGFLVAFDKTDPSKKWQSLILANEQYSVLPPLELQEPPHYLQSAFQTNEQFLVISNPDRETLDYLSHKFQDQIDIAAWPFLLDVAGKVTNSNTSSLYKNILIFKFCNHSLVDRLKNPELWTQPETFNKKSQLKALADWVIKYIDQSRLVSGLSEPSANIAADQHDRSIILQGYADFLQKVDDPNWNGIMALQVTLNLEKLPEAIKGIVAGIDIKRFAAHHFGIDSNQILSTEGRLERDFKSSMFGLISYFDTDYQQTRSSPPRDPNILPPVPGDYDFKVLELQVLFKNSEISDFNCKIQLSINTLFNEPVINESPANHDAINRFSIVLEGLYDKHDGHTGYTFRQLSDNTLVLSSTALRSVNIHGIELSTVHETPIPGKNGEKSDPGEDGRITTRFSLAGQFATRELTDFDMLSYDNIGFSSLYIDMKFDIQAPQRSKQFYFVPGEILLDPTLSVLRDDSLVAHFPITLQSLEYFSPPPASATTTSSSAVSPSSLGYQRVEAPLNYNPIKSTWYALQFNLNLGTMGSLAAKAGFNATVLLSWSPGLKNKAAQIWIKTPFSGGGGKRFSIQGVLKLVTQSIRLEKQPDRPEYAMLFSNIKVSLLGLKLPPSGNTLLYLFGNPDVISTGQESSTGNLGWFGAYKRSEKNKPQESAATNVLPDAPNVTPRPPQPSQ